MRSGCSSVSLLSSEVRRWGSLSTISWIAYSRALELTQHSERGLVAVAPARSRAGGFSRL